MYASGAAPREPLVLQIGHQRVQVDSERSGLLDLAINWQPESPLIHVTHQGRSATLQYISTGPGQIRLQYLGTIYSIAIQTLRESTLAKHMLQRPKKDAAGLVRSPMPGQIVQVMVKPGDEVKQGAELLVMEAMKMQNVLRASRSGKIRAIMVKEGDNVAADQELVVFA